jgi:hypothetical protein
VDELVKLAHKQEAHLRLAPDALRIKADVLKVDALEEPALETSNYISITQSTLKGTEKWSE